jgi:mannose-6-phosphate isomerase-like protein (cupin superfamily)
MPDKQYAKYVQPLRLGTELINPSFRGKISDFALIHDQKTTPESPIRTETFYAYAPGAGAFAPSKLAPIIDGRTAEELKNVGSHSHNDFDEVYYFFGTDSADNTRLGGQVEMWLGKGEDAEKFVMKDPTAVYVPKGLAHNPWIVTKVNDPKLPIMITCVSLTNKYSLAPDAVTNYPYPPAFNPDLIGVPQPGRGKYAQYVNRLTLSQDIYIAFLLGRVCTPNLMFDDKVCRAPLWTEFFLAYAGGTGVGVPTLAEVPKNDGMSYWDWTKGMQHHQSYDEVFLYLPTDPHDILNLGGESVAYLADEDYAFTEPTAIYVPGGVLHNPNYYKRVDRPYYMLVLALTDNAKFHEGEFTPVPAPLTFRF